MIAIISPDARERAAFVALCASRQWTATPFESQQAVRRTLRRHVPKVILMRHKLGDGFSDDILSLLGPAIDRGTTRLIVVMSAGASSVLEARQLSLGADCVLRDPVRTNVLLEYLEKYTRATRPVRRAASTRPVARRFAGAQLLSTERILCHGADRAKLTPREVELAEMLVDSGNEVITYQALYQEILGRPFRGDTSNMRVLLGKLSASAARVGVALRDWVEVIPKLGYRYREVPRKVHRPASGGALLSAA